jgi:hypothetical protein
MPQILVGWAEIYYLQVQIFNRECENMNNKALPDFSFWAFCFWP